VVLVQNGIHAGEVEGKEQPRSMLAGPASMSPRIAGTSALASVCTRFTRERDTAST
jgi:hypothetical protein